ncbi:MAG TPA: metallophosphoesterase family protein [Pirellulales bacterium]
MPSASGRLIAVGDIHGCIHALDALLLSIEPQADDTIVILGDFIDTGRDTCEVIDRLIALSKRINLVVLKGNHEEMLLAALTSEQAREQWWMCGGIATLNSYFFGADIGVIPKDHIKFIQSALDFYETDRFIFCHANYDPQLPLERTPTYRLRWAVLDERDVRPHYSGKKVVVGHTEQRKGDILDLGCVACIDTYCRETGWLTAFEPATGHLWQANRWGVLRTLAPA